MKILLLNQVFYPDKAATAQQNHDLARFLVSEGHEVSIITGQRDYEDRAILYPSEETREGMHIRRLSSTGFGKRRLLGRMIDAASFFVSLAFALARTPKHDLVISFTSPPLIGLFGAVFCLVRGGYSLQWLMDINPESAFAAGVLRRGSPLGRLLESLFLFSLRKSQHMIVLDRWMEAKIRPHLEHRHEVTIVPPWSVVKAPPENLGENPFRKVHGLADNFVVLYSGNHSVVHPLHTLLEAALLLNGDPHITFLFIGKGVRTADVTAFKERHALKNCLQLPPQPRDQLVYSLGSANLHVAVMGKELSGLVHTSKIYGILATGKPFVFIGPRESHVGDLLRECPNGFLVEHDDIEGLVQVIRKAQSLAPADLERISRENIAFVQRNNAPEKIFAHFRRQILTPLGAGSSPTASLKTAAR